MRTFAPVTGWAAPSERTRRRSRAPDAIGDGQATSFGCPPGKPHRMAHSARIIVLSRGTRLIASG